MLSHIFHRIKFLLATHQFFQGIPYNGSCIHYRRNSYSYHRHSQRFLCQCITMISHTGARLDPGIGNLDRSVQSSGTAGSQRIHNDQYIRSSLFYNSAYDFRCLHAGLGHDSRLNAADKIHPGAVICCLTIIFHYMSGDQEVIYHLRSQCIRSHFPVAQAHHQYRLFFLFLRHHFQKFFRQCF